MYVDSYASSTAISRKSTSVKSTGNTKSDTVETAKATSTESTDGGKQVAQFPNDTTTNEENVAADNEKIKKAIENMKAQLPHSEVKFGIHEKTERVTIKLVDKDTKEVIKEFPAEKTLDMIAKCMEIAGVLVDEKL